MIILFDGVCNFCNGAVNFIIRHDAAKRFKFAPLQSEFGEQLCTEYDINADDDSVILVAGGRAYMHSTAALRIARELGGIWPLLYGAMILPRFTRDYLYKLFARNRYRLFGKKDVCMMPTPEIRERFLS